MKNLFVIFIVILVIVNCDTKKPDDCVTAVFPAGMVEYDSEPSKVPKAMQEVPDAVYKATQEEFSSTIDILEKSKKCTMKKLVPPFVYIKTSSSMFVLGRNCVL